MVWRGVVSDPVLGHQSYSHLRDRKLLRRMIPASCHVRSLERDVRNLHHSKLKKLLSRLRAVLACFPATHSQCQRNSKQRAR
eukprot:2134052-Pyramimonas_sp.AAC.1